MRFRVISVPLRLAYGRMRGRVVEKNMRARRCIQRWLFIRREGGGEEEVMSGNERRILLADENIIFERVDLPSAFVIETNVYWKSVPV